MDYRDDLKCFQPYIRLYRRYSPPITDRSLRPSASSSANGSQIPQLPHSSSKASRKHFEYTEGKDQNQSNLRKNDLGSTSSRQIITHSPSQPLDQSPTKSRSKPIWDMLYEQGLEQIRTVELKHKVKVTQLDEECTFKPMIRGKSQRYFNNPQSNFYDRNIIWLENKMKKQVREKQEATTKSLKQCTFTPIMLTKPRPKRSSPKKSNRTQIEEVIQASSHLDTMKSKKVKVQDIRKKIRGQLHSLNL